ncbi:hypothetical protein [Aquibacillus koreensis]|uniref:hypothetical protein n=1 Tax=Aquibacillus koreensis TaxID=279446 RepID=UPI002340C1EF|nr:hypothetical protein [Aquibacillus koreensis]
MNRKGSTTPMYRLGIALLLSMIAAISYFPLTSLAIKETPSVTDWQGITYWIIGHLIYAFIMLIMPFRFNQKHKFLFY